MQTIDKTNTSEWIWTKTKPIGEWDFYKKISVPDSVDIDATFAIIDNETKEAKEKEQEEYLKTEPEPDDK